MTYDHKTTDELDQIYKSNAFNPQWHFGYGLSYASFAYSAIRLSSQEFSKNESLTVEVDVINTSDRDGMETVLLFVNDRFASITPSVRRLRAFSKQLIKAQSTQTFTFILQAKDLAFVGIDNTWITEEGWFDLEIADQKAEFYFK